jgi:hypothetical protein
MRHFSITVLAGTLSMMISSSAVLAQQEPSAAPNDSTVSNAAETMAPPESAAPADRVEAECRDWAVQDGVPENELAEYVRDCVEDRAVQE